MKIPLQIAYFMCCLFHTFGDVVFSKCKHGPVWPNIPLHSVETRFVSKRSWNGLKRRRAAQCTAAHRTSELSSFMMNETSYQAIIEGDF